MKIYLSLLVSKISIVLAGKGMVKLRQKFSSAELNEKKILELNKSIYYIPKFLKF